MPRRERPVPAESALAPALIRRKALPAAVITAQPKMIKIFICKIDVGCIYLNQK
jgi:hypothetical protein